MTMKVLIVSLRSTFFLPSLRRQFPKASGRYHRNFTKHPLHLSTMGHQNARSFVSPWKSSFSFSSFKRKSSSRAAQAFRSSEDLKQIYNWHQNLEDLDQYEPGGLHPAQLGDRISQDRYEIIHKLGYGSYSTVWLAKDHSQYKESYVAIKILKSQAPFAEQEVKCWQHLQDGPAEHPGKRYILPLDDIFSIQGPNGRHLCLVMPVAGCDLYSCKISSSSMFRTDQGRAITARVLLGLSYIHSRGVVHGGKYTRQVWKPFC